MCGSRPVPKTVSERRNVRRFRSRSVTPRPLRDPVNRPSLLFVEISDDTCYYSYRRDRTARKRKIAAGWGVRDTSRVAKKGKTKYGRDSRTRTGKYFALTRPALNSTKIRVITTRPAIITPPSPLSIPTGREKCSFVAHRVLGLKIGATI